MNLNLSKINFIKKIKNIVSKEKKLEHCVTYSFEEVKDHINSHREKHKKRMESFWGRFTWFVQTLPRRLVEAKWWVLHRTLDKYNVIEIPSLKAGYYDKDIQMLHGMFDLLVDYVECELAWMELICMKEERRKVPWWMTYRRYRNKHGRELGMKHLDWEVGLEEEKHQAETAKEQKELYLWWKDIRPKRIDPYSLPEDAGEGMERWKTITNLEQAQEKEDEEMLIRLIKIRGSLWT